MAESMANYQCEGLPQGGRLHLRWRNRCGILDARQAPGTAMLVQQSGTVHHGDETHQGALDEGGGFRPLSTAWDRRQPAEIAPMEAFCRDVLGATVLYADEDFAAVTLLGSVFMLHADHSYQDNPMAGVVAGVEQRGTGIEIRIYGLDPDIAEERARAHGHHVLAGSLDKPHGLRECHIVGPSFYVFVPSLAIEG
jgi:hypothetical protein